MAPIAAAAAVLAVVVGLLAIAGLLPGRPTVSHAHTAVFPGGGRILVADGHGLKWLYPDGKTTRIAPGFIGATLIAGGTKLLAWRPTRDTKAAPPCGGCYAGFDYYLMTLDGTGRRLVLSAEATRGNVQVGYLSVDASPDGTRLAYARQTESRTNGNILFDKLWTVDLATGRRTDLGPAPSSDQAVAWMNDSTLLAESSDSTRLSLVNVDTGQKTTYLTISAPRIVRAYEKARPGAGPPTAIELIGWSTGSGRSILAVLLWGDSHHTPGKTAVAFVEHSRIVTFAPDRNPLTSLTWGPGGIFLIQTAMGDNPCCSRTYVGTAPAAQLSQRQTFGEPWDSAAFNPQGNVIVLDYGPGTTLAFVPTSPPACHRAGRCLRFQPKPLFNTGSLQAWAPDRPGRPQRLKVTFVIGLAAGSRASPDLRGRWRPSAG
jgi:hypothetical protein